MNELTQEILKELFDYQDSELYWKKSGKGRKFGVPAGYVINGYRQIGVNNKPYYTHRLIFLFHHGYLPKFLDHIDGDKSNNNINNLREATLSQNQWNRKKNKSHNGKPTSSKFKGVSLHKASGKWLAQIQIDGKNKRLGLFTSELDAANAYNRAATEAFGKFTKPNKL